MTSTIISSIVLFLGVSILLVVILLVAKKYLVPSGKATITINNDKQIEVETSTLLPETTTEPLAAGLSGKSKKRHENNRSRIGIRCKRMGM